MLSTGSLVMLPTALFLAVYLACMLAAVRVLDGLVRAAASMAALAVLVMLPYCGWSLTAPAAIAVALSRAKPLG